jgi:glycosyltransferase involved in cell wall biosynthesis
MYFSPESLIVPILVGRKATVTIHDISPIRFPSLHTRRTVVINRLLLRVALRRVRRVIVPSHTVRRDIEQYMPAISHKLRVIYEGPKDIAVTNRHGDVRDCESGRQSPYVLYVGTIEPRKNVLRLVDSFLASAPNTWSIVIAGKVGWLSPHERARFETLAENPRVVYLGYVGDELLSDLYAQAAIFAYVSTVEGFGLPILEAMNRGVPVIHSDAEALCEIAGGAGLIVHLEQLDDELRVAIGQLTADPAARSRLSELGKRRAELFTWRKAAQETFGVVSGLGDGGS